MIRGFPKQEDVLIERPKESENSSEDIWYSSTGSVVETAAVQTLTNKTLTTPNVNEAVNLTATSTQLNDAASTKHTQNTDTGTTATSFKINSSGNDVELLTTGLTGDRDFTFPNMDSMIAASVLLAQNSFDIISY